MTDTPPPGATGSPRVAPLPPPPGNTGSTGSTGSTGGPRVSAAQVRDLSRLRRAAPGRGRTVAGVAEGVARHLDVDPVLVKVGFVVLGLFGGAGILLYVALWLLVPDEATGRAVVPTRPETQKVLVVGTGVVAGLIVLGQGWGGWWWFGPTLPLGLAVLVVVALLIGRDRRRLAQAGPPSGPSGAPSPSAPYAAYAAAPPAAGAPAGPAPVPGPAFPPGPVPGPGWRPPTYQPPRPPRPRRTGIIWFWPTLALVALALGGLGLYDTGHAVAQAAYPALALALVGLALVIGAFRGRPGGLVPVGILTALVLGVSTTIGGFHQGQRILVGPATAADVRSSYSMQTGELVVNLAGLDDVAALDGREIELHGGTGVIEVVVPRGVTVHVDADIDAVGGYRIGSAEGGGFTPGTETTLPGPSGSPVLDLEVDLRVGQITVRHPYE